MIMIMIILFAAALAVAGIGLILAGTSGSRPVFDRVLISLEGFAVIGSAGMFALVATG